MLSQEITTTFLLPDWIRSGLANGQYVRTGGVIQNANTKSVVLWLKESLGAENRFSSLSIAPVASVLSLGISVAGFSMINYRLSEVDKQLKSIQADLAKIDRKLDLSFQAKYRAAIDLASNALTMTNPQNRSTSAHEAISLFRQTEPIYLDYVDQELEAQSQAANKYLLVLCLAYVAELRCYLEIGEAKIALQRLKSFLEATRPRFQRYINILLTNNPSAYLDPQLKEEINLSRLTKVYQWFESDIDENGVFEKLRDRLMRWPLDRCCAAGHQWVETLPAGIVSSHEVKGGFWGNQPEMVAEAMKRLPKIMNRIESMIETHRRFESYQYEIQSMMQLGIPFHEWAQLAPSMSPKFEADELTYIIPAEPLAIHS